LAALSIHTRNPVANHSLRKHHVKLAVAGLLFMQHGNASKGLASSPYQFTNPILQIPDISGSNNFVIVHLCLLLACGFENPRVASLNQFSVQCISRLRASSQAHWLYCL
jgi:hypothetical protein